MFSGMKLGTVWRLVQTYTVALCLSCLPVRVSIATVKNGNAESYILSSNIMIGTA